MKLAWNLKNNSDISLHLGDQQLIINGSNNFSNFTQEMWTQQETFNKFINIFFSAGWLMSTDSLTMAVDAPNGEGMAESTKKNSN